MAILLPREITEHEQNAANRVLHITADGAGPGGASHRYVVTIPGKSSHVLDFQNGAIAEAGVNGLTHEALIAIVLDRLRSFQEGPYKCRDNALAITKLEEALMWLNHRTREREARGVEGTMEV